MLLVLLDFTTHPGFRIAKQILSNKTDLCIFSGNFQITLVPLLQASIGYN